MFELVLELVALPTVSGFEQRSCEDIIEIAKRYTGIQFDSAAVTPTGSVVLCRKSRGKNARRVVLDAHIDTIGFVVTELCEGGFVRVASAGGIDANILPASEVMIYGKKNLRGFFTSVPPHLQKSDKLPKISELMVDTGLDDKTLSSLVEVGTPVGFFAPVTRLSDNKIASPSLDDKICVASILECLRLMKDDILENTDVYAYFSSGEERTSLGARVLAETVEPDACVVLDVNFGKTIGLSDDKCLVLGKGAGLSLSSCTSRELTDFIYTCTQNVGLPCQRIVEMTDTGTNAQQLARMGRGIPTAVLSIPLRYMHTSSEVVSMDDVDNCAKILREFLINYDKEPVCIPVYYVKEAQNGYEYKA